MPPASPSNTCVYAINCLDYANTGALLQAARSAKRRAGGNPNAVGCSIVETYGDTSPKSLEETLRLEYRTKLLNPRWASAMADQGSGGAYEISQRFTALVGWGGTADFKDKFVYDGSYETYVEDNEMREKLRKSNPEAYKNVVRRMLEANGRGLWEATEDQLEQLQDLYAEMDEEVERIGVEP